MQQQHQHQPLAPPPATTNSSQTSASSQSVNNNYYSQQQFQAQPAQQQQSDEPTLFQKPMKTVHIQPLIDPNDSMPHESPESPRVDFRSNSQTDDYSAYAEDTYSSPMSSTTRSLNLRYQLFLDKISPHWKARWTFSLVTLMVFMARVVIAEGWYVICYALAIYYLNLLIGFISPKVDPGMGLGDDEDSVGPMLPTNANDEFKPFIRRVPEFKFWISGTKATLLSLFLSLFDIFDVPVFWPILLIYFIVLFACTMRQQIRHMIRYRYVPWDSGKKKYASRSSDSTSNLYPETV